MESNIEKMIEKWEEKHSSILNEYSKISSNNEDNERIPNSF